MADPTFNQSTADPTLYWLANSDLPPGYAIALLLPDGSSAPPAIDLAQSWTTHPGLYVMAGQGPAPGTESTFIEDLRDLQNIFPSLRFVWLADAAIPAEEWQPQVIQVDQQPGAPTGTIAAPVQLVFGSYRLGLAAGLTLATTDAGFSAAGGTEWAFTLRTPDSIWTLSAPQDGSPPTILSFAGAAAGCIALDLALPQDHQNSGIDDYTRLDTGFRFAVDDPEDTNEGLLLSLHYPVFAAVPPGGVSFTGQFDPALPLVTARTRLAYASGASPHDSQYRSQLGHPVTLTPAAQPGDPLPAGLAFHRRPGSRHAPASDDPLYLGPIGSFAVAIQTASTAGDGPAARLTCGLAGTEYFGLPAGNAARIAFTPSEPAYAPSRPAVETSSPLPALTDLATSPWAAVSPAGAQQVAYYAQPDRAALYRVRASAGAGDPLIPYLVFLELAAGAIGPAPPSYPMLPYAGIAAPDLAPFRALEARVLSPTRRAAIQAAATPGKESTLAATPQGLLARFKAGETAWDLVTLVPLPAPPAPPSLAFNQVRGAFREAFQSNQLFLVAANGPTFAGGSDLYYWITPAVLNDLYALPDSERPPDPVLQLLRKPAAQVPQIGEHAFQALLHDVGVPPQYLPTITQYAVYFEIVIGTWRFRLSPSLWSLEPAAPTIMIVKFAGSSLRDLVERTSAWTWPEAAEIGGSTAETQKRILQSIEDAEAQVKAAGGQSHPLDFFVNTVCHDPQWTGVVFLNAQVPFGSMPEELRGLAAGIDANQFRAHHVGLSVTPVEVNASTQRLSLGANSFFGLIDYESPEDIAHTFADFDFKVLQLRVLFRNSAVADFSGRIELFVQRLFDDDVTLVNSQHYNNLILLGSYQRQRGGGGQYVFGTGASNLYSCRGAVLESVEIARAQFTTAAGSPTGAGNVRARFMLWGRLRFRQLAGFDLFSFGYTLNRQGGNADDGYLAYSGLAVDMEFPPSDPTQRTFRFDVADVAFDPSASIARPSSFFARFPLKLQKVIRGEKGQTPKDLGYQGVETPLNQPSLANGWYALLFTLDLGTLGALAANAGLVVTLLAAWSSASGTPEVNVGLQLPGAQALKSLPAIEGVLQSGFQSITLDAQGSSDWPPNPAYVMRFRQFFLKLLTWRFPPGQTDVYLFGDPEAGPQQSGALGWYAAYVKEQS